MRYRGSSILANPSVVYIGVWSIVLFLYMLGLANHFVEVTVIGAIVVFLGFVTSLVAFELSRNALDIKFIYQIGNIVNAVRDFSKKLLIVWFFGSLADVVYSGGFPLLWVVLGIFDKNYTDFGVPTLHGFLNACFLQAVTMLFLCWLVQKKNSDILLICFLLTWPIMMLGRGIFLSAVVQMMAVYLLMNKLRTRTIFGVVVTGLVLVILFGVLGDLRDTPNPFDYLVSDNAVAFFESVPSGFLWVYVYSTSSLNNLFANIDRVVPVWLPVYSISNMFPSVVRMTFGLDPRNDTFEFVDQNLNTSTVYAGAVSDFGPIGAIVFVYAIQQIAAIFYIKARSLNIAGVLGYSVMFQVLLFSVFYDMFFLLPTLMQLIIVLVFYRYCGGKNIRSLSH